MPPAVHPYATISVKSHIPVTLTMKSNASSRWASFFKSMCSVGDSILDLTMTDNDQTTRDLWLTIKGLFRANKQSQCAGMAECHSIATPVHTHAKLSAHDGAKLQDGSEYWSIAGVVQYLTLTRPDLAYAVQQVCIFLHDPHEPHMALIKRILCYVKGTLFSGLHISTGPVQPLTANSNADWAGCPKSWRSTSGFYVYLSDNLVSWSSKRQTMVSLSSAEAEYQVVAYAMVKCCWLHQLLQELHVCLASATVVYCDNIDQCTYYFHAIDESCA
ncbi:uncharacterized protein LOC106804522 [Setaria italica]|uniref:uncharacterized protein LOC106804522 n=1 Tax=Setaria italica TaxID=4555 RepID=UPI000BE56B3F|nr:uncharacterized protein LOC106804522 [Setaria italica]